LVRPHPPDRGSILEDAAAFLNDAVVHSVSFRRNGMQWQIAFDRFNSTLNHEFSRFHRQTSSVVRFFEFNPIFGALNSAALGRINN